MPPPIPPPHPLDPPLPPPTPPLLRRIRHRLLVLLIKTFFRRFLQSVNDKSAALENERREEVRRQLGDGEEEYEGGTIAKDCLGYYLAQELLHTQLPSQLSEYTRMELFDPSREPRVPRHAQEAEEMHDVFKANHAAMANIELLHKYGLHRLDSRQLAAIAHASLHEINSQLQQRIDEADFNGSLSVLYASFMWLLYHNTVRAAVDAFHQLSRERNHPPNSGSGWFMRQVEREAQQFVDSSGELALRRAEEGYILSSLLLKQRDLAYGEYDDIDANLNTMQREIRDLEIHSRCLTCESVLPRRIFAVILKHGGDAPEVQATIVDAKERVAKLEQLLHHIHRNRMDDVKDDHGHDATGSTGKPNHADEYDEHLNQLRRAKASISILESILPKVKKSKAAYAVPLPLPVSARPLSSSTTLFSPSSRTSWVSIHHPFRSFSFHHRSYPTRHPIVPTTYLHVPPPIPPPPPLDPPRRHHRIRHCLIDLLMPPLRSISSRPIKMQWWRSDDYGSMDCTDWAIISWLALQMPIYMKLTLSFSGRLMRLISVAAANQLLMLPTYGCIITMPRGQLLMLFISCHVNAIILPTAVPAGS